MVENFAVLFLLQILTSPPGFGEQTRSDSIQDFSFVRDVDRFSSATKHLNDSYMHPAGSSAQPDMQKEIPPAGLSGLYFQFQYGVY